jgi:hypothetical protein
MLFCPVHNVVIDKALALKQVLEHPLYPHVVRLLLKLQCLYVVEVLLELFRQTLAQVFRRYRRFLLLDVQLQVLCVPVLFVTVPR